MKCRVLVIEGDVVSHRALARMLSRIGYDVTAVSSVREALAQLLTNAPMPQCIILDLMLPDGSGVEVLDHVRARKLPIKVAIATGTTDPQLLDDARALVPN